MYIKILINYNKSGVTFYHEFKILITGKCQAGNSQTIIVKILNSLYCYTFYDQTSNNITWKYFNMK